MLFTPRLLLLLETHWRGFSLNAPPQISPQQVPGPSRNYLPTMSVKKMNAIMRRFSNAQGDSAAIDAALISPEVRPEPDAAPTPTEPAAADATAQGICLVSNEITSARRALFRLVFHPWGVVLTPGPASSQHCAGSRQTKNRVPALTSALKTANAGTKFCAQGVRAVAY